MSRNDAQPLPDSRPIESTVACAPVSSWATSTPSEFAIAMECCGGAHLAGGVQAAGARLLDDRAHGARAGLGVEGAGGLGGAVPVRDELGAGQARERRVLGCDRGRRTRGVARGAQRVVVEAVGGRDALALAEHGADRDLRVLLGDVLVDAVVGEAGERAGLRGDEHFGGVGASVISMILRASSRTSLDGHRHQRPTPTWTLRNRAGEAPCATWATCIGSPLPQLASPHTPQYSREQTASHEFQNFGEMPV